MDSPAGSPLLRIGELSRRLGVSGHVLRAWESRYGLLQPVRSPGGFRLYFEADEARIRRMQAYLAQGLSAAEAARAALGDAPSTHPCTQGTYSGRTQQHTRSADLLGHRLDAGKAWAARIGVFGAPCLAAVSQVHLMRVDCRIGAR